MTLASALIRNEILSPVGVVKPFAGTTAPSGWLLCDGSAISRTTYARLFAVVGTAFGDGDGSTTFNLPDPRGRFIRGVDGGSGNDPDAAGRIASGTNGNTGDNVGSLQVDDFDQHNHGLSNGSLILNAQTGNGIDQLTSATNTGSANDSYTGGNVSEGARRDQTPRMTPRLVAAGGNENRPKNLNMNHIIKF